MEQKYTKVIAYNGEDKMVVNLSRDSKGQMGACIGEDNVFTDSKYKDLKFLVVIDNNISCIDRDQFSKYLMAYSVASEF